jgi:TonB family protein
MSPLDTCKLPPSLQKPDADTVLVLEVTADGRTKNARVWQSSGSKRLDEFAVSCAAALKFQPAYQNRQAVEVTIPLRIAW